VYFCDAFEHGNGSVAAPEGGTSEYGSCFALSVAIPIHALTAPLDVHDTVISAVVISSGHKASDGATKLVN
jgi:hypothetical protein